MTQTFQNSLSQAVSRALTEAELRRIKMSRSLIPEKAAELLASQADQAAASPLAYDQLLALALRAVARPGEFESPELDALRDPPESLERLELAREVFERYREEPYRAVVRAAPDWELRRASRRIGKEPRALADWLRRAADLALYLWDHPALPVEPGFRGAILACVTPLRMRADALAAAPADHPPAPRHPELVAAAQQWS